MPAKRCVFALVAFGEKPTHLMHLVAVEDGGQIPEDWLTKQLDDKMNTEIPAEKGRVLSVTEITDPGVIRTVGSDGGRLKGSANYAMLHGYCVVFIDLTR